jgi:hypothetical protein
MRRWAVRLDAILIIVAAIILLTSVAPALLKFHFFQSMQAPIITGVLAVVTACFAGAMKITAGRQSLLTLYGSEIRAIQYGLSEMRMFDAWISAYRNPERGARDFAGPPRTAEYFAIFHATSNTLVNQAPEIVEAVVRFYTYLKMSRDAAAALGSWEVMAELSSEERQDRNKDVKHVVRLLSLSMIWGYVARHFMGQRSDKADVEQLGKIVETMDAVLEADAFPLFFDRFPHKEALEEFFGINVAR